MEQPVNLNASFIKRASVPPPEGLLASLCVRSSGKFREGQLVEEYLYVCIDKHACNHTHAHPMAFLSMYKPSQWDMHFRVCAGYAHSLDGSLLHVVIKDTIC